MEKIQVKDKSNPFKRGPTGKFGIYMVEGTGQSTGSDWIDVGTVRDQNPLQTSSAPSTVTPTSVAPGLPPGQAETVAKAAGSVTQVVAGRTTA